MKGRFDPGAGPLEGVRVVDMTRLIPGALATRRLADLGADVVKIEEPGRGDYARTIPPLVDGESVIHLTLNRGKRSVALDLKDDAGRATIVSLIQAAHVVVEVSRPGRLGALGFDLSAIRQSHPRLIVCHVSGFGQSGPLSFLPSHGMNTDALGGCLITTNTPAGPHIASRSALGIELGGVNAAAAITAALFRAERTGRGAELDVSCWDSCIDLLRTNLGYFAATGQVRKDTGDLGPLYEVYETADDQLVVFCAIERKFWTSFCQGIDRPDLVDRWDSTGEVDYGSDSSLRAELGDIFKAASITTWQRRFEQWDIPGSQVLTLPDLPSHPHFVSRQMQHADRQGFPHVGDPVVWMDESCRPGLDSRDAPPLGANTSEVLAEWLADHSVNATPHS